MTVYVDDFRAQLGRMVMCHMAADSTRELLDMADLLGLRRDWLQHPGQADEHFDVSLGYRRRAIALGAREVTSRELVEVIRARREQQRERAAV